MNQPRASLTVLCFVFAALALPVSAHNVVSGAYVDGMIVEGEVGFSNGEPAQAGVQVEVWVDDHKQGETVIEAEGLFSYQATAAVAHRFKIDLGAGHVAEIAVEADEFVVAVSATAAAAPDVTTAGAVRTSNTAVVGVSAQQLESIVRRAVAQQIKPLQKELRAYKEKIMFRDIAGGVGFIFGLFGVAAWMAARKERAAAD